MMFSPFLKSIILALGISLPMSFALESMDYALFLKAKAVYEWQRRMTASAAGS